MRLTEAHGDMMFRFALAEHHTSPPEPSKLSRAAKLRVIAWLRQRGILAPVTEPGPGRPAGALRLTDRGRDELRRICGHKGAVNVVTGACLACGGKPIYQAV